ncbi:MAG: hypothetical protein ACYST3_09160 [Planctomycetota bacterium]|jgi:hypothetical protein
MTEDKVDKALDVAIINLVERSDMRQTILTVVTVIFITIVLMAMLGAMGQLPTMW